jgi:hypothetical protein
MAFLAAVLLLNMEEIDAFICFANLINRPMQMAFFSVDQPMVKKPFSYRQKSPRCLAILNR